jgi:hypothetical protein
MVQIPMDAAPAYECRIRLRVGELPVPQAKTKHSSIGGLLKQWANAPRRFRHRERSEPIDDKIVSLRPQ